MQNPLSGKTALVTGAGRRLGRAIAVSLAREGANIVMHHAFEGAENIDELRSELSSLRVRIWQVQADFRNLQECEALVRQVLNVAGSLDILINNASIFSPGNIEELGFEDVVRHIKINAWAPFVLSRDFARLIGRGKIINLLDSRITGYDWSHVAYILSKQVLSILTRMTAIAYAPNITVNGVAPGLILPPAGKDESYLDEMAKMVPLRRHGGAEDIPAAVVYLLKNDFITGQVIYVDGGRHLKENCSGSHPRE